LGDIFTITSGHPVRRPPTKTMQLNLRQHGVEMADYLVLVKTNRKQSRKCLEVTFCSTHSLGLLWTKLFIYTYAHCLSNPCTYMCSQGSVRGKGRIEMEKL
jgi:hypothetical protein